MNFVAVCWQLVWEISIPELFTLLHWPPSVLVLSISLQICHLSMFLVLCSPGWGELAEGILFFLLLHHLNVFNMVCKGFHSPLCAGTCCYTGQFLQLVEIFWLKFMFGHSIPCSPELLQFLLLYKCSWLNPCCTIVVRKRLFSHTRKREKKVHWWFRGVRHWQDLHMKPLVSYKQVFLRSHRELGQGLGCMCSAYI